MEQWGSSFVDNGSNGGIILCRPEEYGPPEIEASEIVFNEDTDFLGEGRFGKVYQGRCRESAVAIKVPRNQNLTLEELESFRKEVAIMSKIFHPNVVLFMGACTQPGNIKIVIERMATDLETFLDSPKAHSLSTVLRMKMARDAAKGMSWLHGISNIIHRDLKPANLLVDQNYNVKVTDFGFSQVLKGSTTTKDLCGPRGTALWMSPEVMNNEEFDKTADVYSFGIILWQIYTLQEPFADFDDLFLFKTAICTHGIRPTIPPFDPILRLCQRPTPASLSSLMQSCWHQERKRRPSFTDIVISLNRILVDLSIDNTQGSLFWKEYFQSPQQDFKEVVKWRDFSEALTRATRIRDQRFDILSSYLATGPEKNKRVSITNFEHAIHWFGDFFLQEKAEETLQEISTLINKPWFHGDIDVHEANGRLNSQVPGTFLVRLSKTIPWYPFTLSLTGKKHLRIKKLDGEYSLDTIYTNKHSTVVGLIESITNSFTPPLMVACPQTPAPSHYEN